MAARTASNAGLSENTVHVNDPVRSPSSALRYGLPFEAVLADSFLRTRTLANGRPADTSAAFRSRTDDRGEGDSGIFFDEFRVGPEEGVVRPPQDRVKTVSAGKTRTPARASASRHTRASDSRRAPTQSARTVTERPHWSASTALW